MSRFCCATTPALNNTQMTTTAVRTETLFIADLALSRATTELCHPRPLANASQYTRFAETGNWRPATVVLHCRRHETRAFDIADRRHCRRSEPARGQNLRPRRR